MAGWPPWSIADWAGYPRSNRLRSAVQVAHDDRFGLAASVWTSDHDRAMRATRILHTGIVWVNTHGTTVSEMPHGGVEHSGYGSDLSMSGLLDYTQAKHVML
ncbi:aldehyde dehydrogenase family protein [Streptomyces sp. KS 21]|uniref:aldehyde dehydrogenase family protein n=1 Tax=Streptomyces sp. KS 21 TaxID=2485150 RepID=UPI00244478A2|nr:aldehyde dehydrogenase family protein [Streptomyces sp. KS 21]